MAKKILIVDDIDFILKFEEEILQTLAKELQVSFEIDVAHNVQEALVHIRKTNYDIMIVDMNLPDGSGLDIAKKLKEKNSHTPIAVLSLFPEKEETQQYVNMLLKKPITPTLYKKAVQQLLHL